MAFTYNTRVRFHEADPAGLAFFANILTYCHTAYEELLLAGGAPLADLLKDGKLGLPLVHAEADFKAPLMYGAPIRVTVVVAELKERTFTLAHTITDDGGNTLATARTVHACIDRSIRKTTALPEVTRAALAAHA